MLTTSATTYATEMSPIFELKYVGIWYFITRNSLFIDYFLSLRYYVVSKYLSLDNLTKENLSSI